jgi:sulfide:quinone oxidoreductase
MTGSTYAAAWREGDGAIASGRLAVAESHLELGDLSVSADELVDVRVGRELGERVRGRPSLVLERRGAAPLHVTPVLGVGQLHELAGRVQAWLAARPDGRGPLRVVVAGGGFAGAETVLALRHHAQERVEITLLAPDTRASYRPLSVLEPFGGAPTRGFDLAELAEEAGAHLHLDGLAAVDPERRVATTAGGERLAYDALVVATGARAEPAVQGALTLGGPAASQLLDELRSGAARRACFVVPTGTAWSLPAYELALLTAEDLRRRGVHDAALTLVTAERAPLAVFGDESSDAVAARLEQAGVEVLARVRAVRALPGRLELASGATLDADRVVAIPRLAGPQIPGLPADAYGFLPTDPYCHVAGAPGVYAAGDAAAFPIKQGGLAAQQADTAAAGIAALAGADVRPEPFRPVLRGLLLTGGRPLYLRAERLPHARRASHAAEDPLWWPPTKVVARHLAPYLAARAAAPTA